jgi:hypothetical protein
MSDPNKFDVPDTTFVCQVPPEYGAITGLRVENGCIVASTESGRDFLVPTEGSDAPPN